MRRRRPRIQEPEEFYFPLRGGLDLLTPSYQVAPGRMIDCFRYELAPSGGYKPIDGFERVDGQGLPSSAVFQYLEMTDPTTTVTVGTEVTGSISGAKGVSLIDAPFDFDGEGVEESMEGKVVVLLTSSVDFQAGEEIRVNSNPVDTIAVDFTPNTELSDSHEAHYKYLAVEALRAKINKVPGGGPVRGVWRYQGDLYAFRDNEAGTACVMFKEDSVAGWAAVPSVPTLLPGGAYLFINTNFRGSASTIKMYGCDGKNKAFEFDGSTFTQISTGMAVDAPIYIYEHKKHLFLGFPNGSLQHSPPTDPTGTWSVVVNAGELGMGEAITGLLGLPGDVLGIWCKDSIHILYGSSADAASGDAWKLTTHTKESGGIAGTIQKAGKIYFLNNTGLADFNATNAYGSFKSGTVSSTVKPLLDIRKGRSCAAAVVAGKNQYRLFFEDGYWITMDLSGKYPQFTQAHYDKVVRCISAPKRADDEPGAVYFGSDDGFIYKMDSGVSLDEKPMMAYCRLPYSSQGQPRVKKRYRELVAELDQFSGNNLQLSFLPDFSFTRSDVPAHAAVNISESTAGAGIWDISEWNNFSWDGGNDSESGGSGTAAGDIEGVATEMGLMLYFEALTTTTPLHIINGLFIYFNRMGRQA